MFVTLHGIWVERTDGMPCEWAGTCARRSSYNLDDDGEGAVSNLNLCTQHAKIAMRRATGRMVMAKDLERAVSQNLAWTRTALQAFSGRMGRRGGGHGFRGCPVLKGRPESNESGGPVEVAQDVDPVLPGWQGISAQGKAAARLCWGAVSLPPGWCYAGVMLMCITVASASRRDVVQRAYP